MSSGPISWHVAFGERGGVAKCGDRERMAETPAALFRLIAADAPDGVVHLPDATTEPEPSGLARASAQLRAERLGAVIGRVRYADGSLSGRFGKIETMRFLAVPPGALLVEAGQLAGAATDLVRPWDRYWAHDLANALRARGVVGSSGEVVATVAGLPPATPRLPFARANPLPSEAPPILVYGPLEASVSLYFDGLPADLRSRLRFLAPGDLFSDMGWLAAASLVIVVRGFEHMLLTGTRDLLDELGTPYMWFTDDDLGTLATEVPSYDFYQPDALRSFASGAAGIITTSTPLAARLSAFNVNVIVWPLVYDAALAAGRPAGGRRAGVGAIGGAFRHAAFTQHVLPAVSALGLDCSASADLSRGAAGVRPVPFEGSFAGFVGRWQALQLRAVVHPEGRSGNIGNKSRATLLAAVYLGAVPVVGQEPAYAGLGPEQGVLVAAPTQKSWQAALARLADAAEAEALFARFEHWCRAEFDPEKARVPFAALSALCLEGDAEAQAERWQRACQSRAVQQALPARGRLPQLWQRLSRTIRRRFRPRTPAR